MHKSIHRFKCLTIKNLPTKFHYNNLFNCLMKRVTQDLEKKTLRYLSVRNVRKKHCHVTKTLRTNCRNSKDKQHVLLFYHNKDPMILIYFDQFSKMHA